MILAAVLAATTPVAARVDAVATRAGLAGEVLVAKGDKVLLDKGYGSIRPEGGARHKAGERWRLASFTKQVAATLLLRDHPSALDRPVPRPADGPLPGHVASGALMNVTLRQLLTHHTGLPNPDDTATEGTIVPSFYRRPGGELSYCLSRTPIPASPFRYNNCDYLLAYAGLNGVRAWPSGMRMARPGEFGVPGFVDGKPEPAFDLTTFGAAGGLIGTAQAMLRFDRALMTGVLVSPAVRDCALWKPEGNGSAQALGQWVFSGKLAGCDKPKRIVQRDGEIFGVQARNFILPDDDLVVIVFTNRSSDDFALGEVWQGKGFVYDLLSAAACG